MVRRAQLPQDLPHQTKPAVVFLVFRCDTETLQSQSADRKAKFDDQQDTV